jgi:hypothetical protein
LTGLVVSFSEAASWQGLESNGVPDGQVIRFGISSDATVAIVRFVSWQVTPNLLDVFINFHPVTFQEGTNTCVHFRESFGSFGANLLSNILQPNNI